jgi:hypothetical protein
LQLFTLAINTQTFQPRHEMCATFGISGETEMTDHILCAQAVTTQDGGRERKLLDLKHGRRKQRHVFAGNEK